MTYEVVSGGTVVCAYDDKELALAMKRYLAECDRKATIRVRFEMRLSIPLLE